MQPLMQQIGLYSPVHLYSIIQLYLGDKYETGHRNTLYIYQNECGSFRCRNDLIKLLTCKMDMKRSENRY